MLVVKPGLEREVARIEPTIAQAMSALLFGKLLIAGAVLRADDAVLGTVGADDRVGTPAAARGICRAPRSLTFIGPEVVQTACEPV